MLSEEFMRFLMNYQKDEFTPPPTQKEIKFDKKGGKLVKVVVEVRK